MTIIWSNLLSTHHRWMARYLRKRGWVCFYLEEQSRECLGDPGRSGCWLHLYNQGEAQEGLAGRTETP